jgi:hypothetical protein
MGRVHILKLRLAFSKNHPATSTYRVIKKYLNVSQR